jgi:hypothetical protein
MNKNLIDSFNKDKRKCQKCKEYYDFNKKVLCGECCNKWVKCYNKWTRVAGELSLEEKWERFLNEQ